MVDTTDTPDGAARDKDPNADLRTEIEEKRQAIFDIKSGHAETVIDQAADVERRQLQAESARLDNELATAQAQAEHQANARSPLDVGREGTTEDSSVSSRRRRRPRNTSSTDGADTGGTE